MEYSVINYSRINADDGSLRIDAEHYRNEYLHVKKLLLNRKSEELLSFIDRPVMTGHTPSMKNDKFYDGNINFIKTDNLREHYIEGEFTHKLSNEGNTKIKRSSLKENDVLVTIIGATFQIVGRACLVKKKDLPANINQNIALIRLSKKISPEYLAIYLNSYYGRNYLWYLSRQTEQVNLNCREVEKLLIPILSDNLTELIVELHSKAYSLYEKADELIQKAEQILLSEISLLNWKPKHRLSFVKNFSNSQSSDRIDAEYFQPMYEEIEKLVSGYSKGFDRVKNQFKQNKKSFKRIADKNYNYIEISCVNISDGSMSPMAIQGAELPANAKIKFSIDDVIVSKVRPYRGAIGIVKDNDYVGSGAFTALQENGNINKETLFVFLRSKPMLAYSLKFNTGTSYPTITDDDILNFPLPLIDTTTQEQIKDKVKQGINARYISRAILDIAKRGIELAIEKDEKQAKKWIGEELKKLNICNKKVV